MATAFPSYFIQLKCTAGIYLGGGFVGGVCAKAKFILKKTTLINSNKQAEQYFVANKNADKNDDQFLIYHALTDKFYKISQESPSSVGKYEEVVNHASPDELAEFEGSFTPTDDTPLFEAKDLLFAGGLILVIGMIIFFAGKK